MKKLLVLSLTLVLLVGCAPFKNALSKVPLGVAVTVPGVELATGNDENGPDVDLKTDYGQMWEAFWGVFYHLPKDLLMYVFRITDDIDGEVTEGTDSAGVGQPSPSTVVSVVPSINKGLSGAEDLFPLEK